MSSVLTCRASLVPVFSFGENELYVQVSNPKGSKVRAIQDFLTRYFGFSPPLFHGRGIFNYSFGLLPYRKPITTVGKSMTVAGRYWQVSFGNPCVESTCRHKLSHYDQRSSLSLSLLTTQYAVDSSWPAH